jgi:hypothetical protein
MAERNIDMKRLYNFPRLLKFAVPLFSLAALFSFDVYAEGQDSTDTDNDLQPPKVTGYAQINYIQFLKEPSQDKISGFNISRVRFAFEGAIIPGKVEYAVEFDPQGTPILDDTYLDFIFSENAKIRTGRYKIPFGTENPTGEDELNFIEKSRIVENVFSPREVGVGTLFNLLKFSGDVGYFQKAEDQHIERDVIGHLGVMPFGEYIDIGASGYYEHVSTDSTRFALKRFGVDGTLTLGPIQAQGEVIWSQGALENTKEDAFGYYAYLLYNHSINKIPVTWGVRYEYYDPDKHIRDDHEVKYVGGLTIQFHPRMRMQINYQRITQAMASKDITQNKVIAQYQFNF